MSYCKLTWHDKFNINILKQLFLLLEPYGYIDYELLESNDYRGIDTAFISKFKILDSKLHYITFSGEFEDKDTRPILDISININNRNVKVYNVHFYAFEKPTALSSYDDTIVMPDQYKNVLTAKARYYVHQFKDNIQQAAFALEDYKKAVKVMKSNLINPQPKYMTDDRRYF